MFSRISYRSGPCYVYLFVFPLTVKEQRKFDTESSICSLLRCILSSGATSGASQIICLRFRSGFRSDLQNFVTLLRCAALVLIKLLLRFNFQNFVTPLRALFRRIKTNHLGRSKPLATTPVYVVCTRINVSYTRCSYQGIR